MMQQHLTQGELPSNMIRVMLLVDPTTFVGEIHNWCEKHCTGEWTTDVASVWFENEEDAILFKLSHS